MSMCVCTYYGVKGHRAVNAAITGVKVHLNPLADKNYCAAMRKSGNLAAFSV